MTDQQSYLMIDGTPMLTIDREETIAADLLIKMPMLSEIDSVRISPRRLLAMIDAAAPDQMRAYLRETAPEVIADLYRPAPAAAEHFDYLDAVPEADSPEDVDERSGVEQRLYVIDRLARSLRAGTDAELVTALAEWVLDR